MLGRNNKNASNAQGAGYTYLEKGATITGDIVSSGALRCDGHVKGNVFVKGNLEISAGASIEGETIECEHLILHGVVQSNVVSKGKITITKTGKLIGDVRASALDIEAGATFSGRSEMNSVNAVPSNAKALPSAFETAKP
jgi:cytoskeletal protein CcmA (bactofilin family)